MSDVSYPPPPKLSNDFGLAAPTLTQPASFPVYYDPPPPAPGSHKYRDAGQDEAYDKLIHQIAALQDQTRILQNVIATSKDPVEVALRKEALDQVAIELLQNNDLLEDYEAQLKAQRSPQWPLPALPSLPSYRRGQTKVRTETPYGSPILPSLSRIDTATIVINPRDADKCFRTLLPSTSSVYGSVGSARSAWIPLEWAKERSCDELFNSIKEMFPLMYVYNPKGATLKGYCYPEGFRAVSGYSVDAVKALAAMYAESCKDPDPYRAVEFYLPGDSTPIVAFHFDNTRSPTVHFESKDPSLVLPPVYL